MSPNARKAHNERIAREKALYTHVYISGFTAHHTLEVGLAYYYRGHYIYAYPAGNLLEPIPYSTRKGIMIQGIVSGSAPAYDASAAGLPLESSVSALKKSIISEQEAQEQSASASANTTAVSSAGNATSSSPPLLLLFSSPPHTNTDDPHRPLSSTAPLRESALNTFTPRHGASLLAASAPGSRLASRAASPSGLRPIASHVGLARLGAILGRTPSASRCAEANSIAEEGSARGRAVGWLMGLGDHALGAAELRSLGSGTGRVAPCAIDGEECGGVATAESWLTERARCGKGFVEKLPMVEGGGRMMVDWMRLLVEEKAGDDQKCMQPKLALGYGAL
ncbi:uncharacterized protein EKO05_0005068 [Ascochyta rabiei]|uniref:Uncharacterized protein n=1 Tax=Didymella rabiei TaxID=5454 RepID=A0A163BT00_DIDRA|nr:uncharacterized protein EKO05_0005068 [Ascochyta rabiei]KZM21960.1 hypothetical protein ST47_g6886 [Ascochyta rabiei]UPX14590.1 hypothetical protein EKO05_0005068 [Ascochyta rabiei]